MADGPVSGLAAATELTDADLLLISQGGVSKQLVAALFWLPTNYIGGLLTSNDAGDADHDVAIAPGIARSDDDAANLKLASILTKQIDGAWAVGDDAGGLDTGAVGTDLMYAVWLIKRPDTGVVDALFSLDFAAPTMPADYTLKRLIGAVRTDGSDNIMAFLQSGDYFRYMDTPVLDVNDNTMVSTTFETGTLSVPPSCLAEVYCGVLNTTETGTEIEVFLKTAGASESGGSTSHAWASMTNGSDSADGISAQGSVLVDASRQVEYACKETAGTATVTVITYGFTMLTRREP